MQVQALPLIFDNDGWPRGQDPDDTDPNNPGGPFVDTDGDGEGDQIDDDDDNDGVLDGEDAFPLDPLETLDSDGDGIGNNTDSDDDNDSVPDTLDAFPLTQRSHSIPMVMLLVIIGT